MAAEEVQVKFKANNGDYVLESTDPPGWKDMFQKFIDHDPLFFGIEVGQNLNEGILFKFELA